MKSVTLVGGNRSHYREGKDRTKGEDEKYCSQLHSIIIYTNTAKPCCQITPLDFGFISVYDLKSMDFLFIYLTKFSFDLIIGLLLSLVVISIHSFWS